MYCIYCVFQTCFRQTSCVPPRGITSTVGVTVANSIYRASGQGSYNPGALHYTLQPTLHHAPQIFQGLSRINLTIHITTIWGGRRNILWGEQMLILNSYDNGLEEIIGLTGGLKFSEIYREAHEMGKISSFKITYCDKQKIWSRYPIKAVEKF